MVGEPKVRVGTVEALLQYGEIKSFEFRLLQLASTEFIQMLGPPRELSPYLASVFRDCVCNQR